MNDPALDRTGDSHRDAARDRDATGVSTETSPIVTIVMPAYNRADLIAASIESALGQTYGDFELIVIDDGSTDATAQVVRSFADRRIRLLQGEHRGMSAAMNAGVRAARGRYYARLDSDDLWDRRFLEITVGAMEQRPHVGVVYPRARTFSSRAGLRQADRGRPMTFPDRPFHSMLLGDHASGAALVRVECHLRLGGYDESLPLWEDWDFWLRISRHYDFHFVDQVLAYLRVHPGNVSSSGSAERWRSRRRVLDKVFADDAPLPDEAEQLRGQAYRNVFFDIGRAYWSEGAFRDAAGFFQDGIRASDHRARAAATVGYLLCLHHLGRVPHFWTLHGALSRARRALGWRSGRVRGEARLRP